MNISFRYLIICCAFVRKLAKCIKTYKLNHLYKYCWMIRTSWIIARRWEQNQAGDSSNSRLKSSRRFLLCIKKLQWKQAKRFCKIVLSLFIFEPRRPALIVVRISLTPPSWTELEIIWNELSIPACSAQNIFDFLMFVVIEFFND